MRLALSLLLAVVLVGGAGLGPATEADAGHQGRNCGIISKGSADYRVRASFMKCKAARKASAKYLRSQTPRRGFNCAVTEGGGFYCQSGRKAYWAVRL